MIPSSGIQPLHCGNESYMSHGDHIARREASHEEKEFKNRKMGEWVKSNFLNRNYYLQDNLSDNENLVLNSDVRVFIK